MIRITVLAAAAAAAIALTACGGTGASPAPAAAPSSSAAAAAAPLTCKQKADAWKAANAPALASFKAALAPFAAGGTVTSGQAHALATTAQAAEDVPPPACADPKGFYGQALAQLVTAGTAAEGGGLLSEVGALGPMENAETALSQLDAELPGTIGESKL